MADKTSLDLLVTEEERLQGRHLGRDAMHTPERVHIYDSHRRRKSQMLCSAAFAGGVLVAFLILKAMGFQSEPRRPLPQLPWAENVEASPLLAKSCGSTPDEARAAGCVLDMLTTAWTPAECVDEDLTREFMDEVSNFSHWPFYHDEAGSIELPVESLASGELNGTFFCTMEYHLLHCMYAFMRIHKAYLGGATLDTVLLSPKHTYHCSVTAASRRDPHSIGGESAIFYREC